MTSERDTRVSEAYREAAGETAPEHLNQAILAKAKRAVRPPYARSRAWTRPLAWAATIVLSVAIVLELTQVEELDGLSDDFALPATEEADVAAEQASKVSTTDEMEFEREDLPAEILEEAQPASPEPAAVRAEPVKSEAEPLGRSRKSQDAPARVTAEDFELRDKDLLKNAEDAAELRQNEPKASARALTPGVSVPSCPDDARQEPESWLACVTRLEEAGRHEEAEQERRLLAEAFPDFELP